MTFPPQTSPPDDKLARGPKAAANRPNLTLAQPRHDPGFGTENEHGYMHCWSDFYLVQLGGNNSSI
jgi:hypothetical protein